MGGDRCEGKIDCNNLREFIASVQILVTVFNKTKVSTSNQQTNKKEKTVTNQCDWLAMCEWKSGA